MLPHPLYFPFMNEVHTILIEGSSRSQGNTALTAQYISDRMSGTLHVHLNHYEIYPYDYAHQNEDDFIPLVEQFIEAKNWVFLTPVYWYTMSGILKTFLDRITDLLKVRKDLGYQLKDKNMYLISMGTEPTPVDSFQVPFLLSAQYLGMHFKKYVHLWKTDLNFPPEVLKELDTFIREFDH